MKILTVGNYCMFSSNYTKRCSKSELAFKSIWKKYVEWLVGILSQDLIKS